jgi:hypothetical protein
MESSPACWAAYGEVLAREYGDPSLMATHRLGVDAYAAQHPGRPSPQSIQSVGLHLVRLCLLLEHGLEVAAANKAMLAAARRKHEMVWLQPPASLGAVTVADVWAATTAERHVAEVRRWAQSVWAAWAPHHRQLQGWLPRGYLALR